MSVFIIPGDASPSLFVEDQFVDLLQLLWCVFVALGNFRILGLFSGGTTLMPGAPSHNSGNHIVALVGVDRLYELDN